MSPPTHPLAALPFGMRSSSRPVGPLDPDGVSEVVRHEPDAMDLQTAARPRPQATRRPSLHDTPGAALVFPATVFDD
jgi:hypothetical protein